MILNIIFGKNMKEMRSTIFFLLVVLGNNIIKSQNNSSNSYINFENDHIKKIIEITKTKNKEINYIEGYRIQIFSGSYKECYQEEMKFKEKFPTVKILRKIENPFYKLWVGAYKDQFMANYEIKKYIMYFKSSIVIPDKIYYSEL